MRIHTFKTVYCEFNTTEAARTCGHYRLTLTHLCMVCPYIYTCVHVYIFSCSGIDILVVSESNQAATNLVHGVVLARLGWLVAYFQ